MTRQSTVAVEAFSCQIADPMTRLHAWLLLGSTGLTAAAASVLASCAVGSDGGDLGDDASTSGDGAGCNFDLSSDRNHCGACKHSCSINQSCEAGVCKNDCNPPQIKCVGEGCVDITTDPDNCGACGVLCHAPYGGTSPDAAGPDADNGQRVAKAQCKASTCGYGCPQGSAPCDDAGCFDLSLSNDNCGSCDNACPPGQQCMGGTCCTQGNVVCSGSCTDPRTDPNHCGTCSTQCAALGQSCDGGVCACAPGLVVCSSACTNTKTDTANCGTCGNKCPNVGAICTNGTCQCPLGQTACNGVCTNVQTDTSNCGTCGNKCPNAGDICNAGTCMCPTGDILCDGGCTAAQIDPKNCGTCGFTCDGGAPYCSSGACINGLVYDEQFTTLTTYHAGTTQFDNWKNLLAALTGTYGGITISGSLDTTGVTCTTSSAVNQITQALHNGTTTNVSCNGHTWYTGTCGNGMELALDTGICSCSASYTLRPMIDVTDNWGGVKTAGCPPPSQQMKLVVN